jgi:hypothetical protein
MPSIGRGAGKHKSEEPHDVGSSIFISDAHGAAVVKSSQGRPFWCLTNAKNQSTLAKPTVR